MCPCVNLQVFFPRFVADGTEIHILVAVCKSDLYTNMIFPCSQSWQVGNFAPQFSFAKVAKAKLLYNFPRYIAGHILKHLLQSSWSTFYSASLFGENSTGQHVEPWQFRIPYRLFFMHKVRNRRVYHMGICEMKIYGRTKGLHPYLYIL